MGALCGSATAPANPVQGEAMPMQCCGSRKDPKQAPASKELSVMTLNLQYFSSYPKDDALARKRLEEVLGGEYPPDVICVQEGLGSRNVLSDVGYRLEVCSAREGKAQTVYEMVYGDAQTLKVCDPAVHQEKLCNQIYVRENSGWTVDAQGCEKISTDLNLAGGGGRLTGKLAIRSMAWVRLRHEGVPRMSTFVLCSHISGGRFEDQYFVQQLAEERKEQVKRIIDFFNNRPSPQDDDVGILVGDFNATHVYTKNGPMHGYYASSIATSEGVKADAAEKNVTDDDALEDLFKAYMVSPFWAISHNNWKFAYDRQQVGYTSGFGHCIDHMAYNRTLQVVSTTVEYLTNQKFSKDPADTELPLTDHNAVKSVFLIEPVKHTETLLFRTEYDFLNHLRSYKALVHFSGFGSRQQFKHPEQVIDALSKELFEGEKSLNAVYGEGQWAACYGGDALKLDEPDVAVLVDALRQRHKMHLIAIQADIVEQRLGGVGSHVDAVYYYPTEYYDDAPGVSPKARPLSSVAWGGFLKDKRLAGTTRILLEVNPLSGLPMYWVAAGGGAITRDEVEAAWERDVAVFCYPAEAKEPQDQSLPYGPCKEFWDALADYETDAVSAFRRKRT
mmetsp:Transcript_88755/g.248350  ORF Transcript_88755/g.248350 Transcript_88755/m.248350 type:complete len:616 (-) Transcript_88755:195-2042(-)